MRTTQVWHQRNSAGKKNLEVPKRVPATLFGGKGEICSSIFSEIVLPVRERVRCPRVGRGEKVWSVLQRDTRHLGSREREVERIDPVAVVTPACHISGVLLGVSRRHKLPNVKSRRFTNEKRGIKLPRIVVRATYRGRMRGPTKEVTHFHPQKSKGTHQLGPPGKPAQSFLLGHSGSLSGSEHELWSPSHRAHS